MFLTKEDPRALVKGSRDPLGIQPIWYRLGRHVISNLTTQSNSVRGFTILLLARYLTERMLDEGAIENDDAVDVFLHTEQIGAYVRHLQHGVEGDIRGIDRVRVKCRQTVGRIPIDAGAEGKILSDQKLYGLWGLFSSPARISGLIEEGPIGTTAEAHAFVEANYWPHLTHEFDSLRKLLRDGGSLNGSRPDPIFGAFSKILTDRYTDQERTFYTEYLLDGVHVSPYPLKHQRLLAEMIRENIPFDRSLGREQFQLLCDLAKTKNDLLYKRLDQIVRAESVFAIAMVIFEYALSLDGHSIAAVDRSLGDQWGKGIPNIDAAANADIVNEIKLVYPDSDISVHFERCQRALQEGRFDDVLEILIAWNKQTQARRGSAPWVRIGSQGKLEVHYRSPRQILPSADELPHLWRYLYFLPSVQNITRQLTLEAA